MQMEIADPTGRAIDVCLIDQLDDNGYLTSDLAELDAQLGCALERIEAVLAVLQDGEPTVVFAPAPAEFLALLLREREPSAPAIQPTVEKLEPLGKDEHAWVEARGGVLSEGRDGTRFG